MASIVSGASWLLNQTSNLYSSSGTATKSLAATVGIHGIYHLADWTGRKIHQYTGFSMYKLSDRVQSVFRKYSSVAVKPFVEAVHGPEAALAMKGYMKLVIKYPGSPQAIQAIVRRCITDPIFTCCTFGPLVEELAFRAPMLLMDEGLMKNIYMVASSIIFSLSHEKSPVDTSRDNAGRALALTAMGLTFAHITGGDGLSVAVLSHGLYNFTNWLVKSSSF